MGGGKRNSNLELLRILSMIMIVFTHYAGHGYMGVPLTDSVNQYILTAMKFGGSLGVNCFVLITGFYMVNTTGHVGKKLLKLWGQELFYSAGILLFFLTVLPGKAEISIKTIVMAVTEPVRYGNYWFVWVYAVLILFSPVLNIIIAKLDKKTLFYFILSMVFIFSAAPTFLATHSFLENAGKVVWFVMLYLISAYIKLYHIGKNTNPNRHFIMAFLMILISCLISFGIYSLGFRNQSEFLLSNGTWFFRDYSTFPLLAAVELLIGFSLLPEKHNRLVCMAASSAFGVYLIHDHNLMRIYLWQDLLGCLDMYESPFLAVHAIGSVFIVYVTGTLIDQLRQKTVGRLYNDAVDKYYENLKTFLVLICHNTKQFLFKYWKKFYNI